MRPRATTTTSPQAAAARRRWVRSGTLIAGVAALGTVSVVGARGATTANWPVYHGTAAGSGAATGVAIRRDQMTLPVEPESS